MQGAVRVNALTVLDAGFEGKKRSKKRCNIWQIPGNECGFSRSYNQTKFFGNYVIVVIIPTGACQLVALWSCIKQGLWRVPSVYGVKSDDNIVEAYFT